MYKKCFRKKGFKLYTKKAGNILISPASLILKKINYSLVAAFCALAAAAAAFLASVASLSGVLTFFFLRT